MQQGHSHIATNLDELDLISTIWIIASNDENHLITFEGIRERLGLEKSYDLNSVVLKHRELFRPGAPPEELEEWQDSMRDGKRQPTWIKIISDDPKRLTAINSLKQTDVFRSQFRVNKRAPKSQIEIVNWGLEHIDRIRKSRIAARNANAKSWQMWLAVVIGVLNIIATISVAYLKGNECTTSKTAATASQPIVPGDTSQAGLHPPAPRP